MTLVATVLLTAIAATIALVLVRQTVLLARAETVRGDFNGAYQAAAAVKLEFERELNEDPQFFYKRLFKYERPRVCDSAAVIPPEDPAAVDDSDPSAPSNVPWPAECPASWGYLEQGQFAIGYDEDGDQVGYDPVQHPVRVEISPPSPTRSSLEVKFLANHGTTETGLTATYRPSSATSVTAYSAADLRLDALLDGSDPSATAAEIAVRGTMYSGKQLYLPTRAADFTGAQLFAESGFVGTVPDTGRFYTSGVAHLGGELRDIRSVVTSKLTLDGLRGSYTRMEQVACPGGTPENMPASTYGVRYSSALCLRHGQQVVNSAGSTSSVTTTGTALGAKPAAYLLKFAGTASAPTVNVWTAATPPANPGECLIKCDLVTLATADFNAKRHPVSDPATVRSSGPTAPLWQPLGEFALPVGGVLATDADTYVGSCKASITGSNAAADCAATVAARSVTVLAGSPSDPKDIVLAGPVSGVAANASTGTPSAQVGLVGTRSVIVPFYARRPGGNLNVQANLAAFGYGLKAGPSGLRAYPARQAAKVDNPRNYGGTFTLTGSVAAPSLETALPGWTRVVIESNPASVASPPPLFPAFSNTWVGQGTSRLSSFDVCGAANCSTKW